MDDRPIKLHCDEEMRAHIAFVLRRYRNERLIDYSNGGNKDGSLRRDIDLTNMCLKEADETGT